MIDARALDDALLGRFAATFFGFGSEDAPFWLVTPEPLDEVASLKARVSAWAAAGEPLLVDAPAFERDLGALMRRSAALAPLLRILLDAFGEPCAPFDVEEYLRGRAGRAGDRLALAHLFAVPLRRAGRWDAHEISRQRAFRSRTAFLDAFAAERSTRLRELIFAAAPRLVMMVGNVYGAYWEALADGPLSIVPDVPLRRRRVGPTLFVQIAQPDVVGSINATRSGAVAAFIRESLGPGVGVGRGE